MNTKEAKKMLSESYKGFKKEFHELCEKYSCDDFSAERIRRICHEVIDDFC